MASKYQPLTDFLLKQNGESVTISFDKINSILGFDLPPSASDTNAITWWANDTKSHSQTNAWLNAGYKTKNVSNTIGNREINFVKELEESNSEFEKIKRVCMEEFPKSVRNYREVTIKTLLESPGFTAERATILENIDKLNFGRGHGTAPEMIREYLDIKYNIVETNGNTYSLLLSPNTSSEQVNELLKICGQTIAKYHIKKMMEQDDE